MGKVLDPELAALAEELLGQGHSQRETHSLLLRAGYRISRGSIQRIDYERRELLPRRDRRKARGDNGLLPEPSGPIVRHSCGRLVRLAGGQCLACEAEKVRATTYAGYTS